MLTYAGRVKNRSWSAAIAALAMVACARPAPAPQHPGPEVQAPAQSRPDAPAAGAEGSAAAARFRTVLFDFGGVLVDLDNDSYHRRMAQLVGRLDDPRYLAIGEKFETGKISPAQFRQALRQLRPQNQALTDQAIDDAWNSQIGPVDCRKVALIQRLKRAGYAIYALSTTNALHVPLVVKSFSACLPGVTDPLAALFIKVYFTNEIGVRKPALAAYRHVIDDAGIDPRTTLFIDDSPANVVGAEHAGLYSILIVGDGFLDWLPQVLSKAPGE